MMSDGPVDPFLSPEASEMMSGLYLLYSAACSSGFPEQRAFDLIDHFFLSYMATAQMLATAQAQQEG